MLEVRVKGSAIVAGYRRTLFLSTALVALACVQAAIRPASAQSVTGSGDLMPGTVVTPNWPITGDLNVGNTATGTLTIGGGGSVTNTGFGYIGKAAGSNGTVNVSGTDGAGKASTWTNGRVVHVGEGGTGTLNVTDGGKVNASAGGNYTIIGNSASAVGTVNVSGVAADGTRSSFITLDRLYVGENGTGTLNIRDGALASSEYTMAIGDNAGSTGLVEVDGINAVTGDRSTLVVAHNLLWVGAEGNGTLNIRNGGLVDVSSTMDGSVPAVLIGYATTNKGLITVDGIDQATGLQSTLNTTDIDVGLTSKGQLDITNGGLVKTTGNIWVGELTNANGPATGIMNVDGIAAGTTTSSTATIGGTLYVGQYGDGTLNVKNGGLVTAATSISIGTVANATGVATVDGARAGIASTLTTSGDLNVGEGGTGTLNVTNGGSASVDGITYIGHNAGSHGEVIVSGTNGQGHASALTSTVNDVVVGQFGTGKLTVEGGGLVSNQAGYIGASGGGNGAVLVSGTDGDGNASTWTNTFGLHIGDKGTGELTIQGGGKVGSAGASLGESTSSSKGTVTVSGSDADGNASTWTNNGDLYVGDAGNGTLNIEDGGLVTNTGSAYIANQTDSVGTVTVTGVGSDGSASTWTNTGDLYVGYNGTGKLNILDGGHVSNTLGTIGAGGDGHVLVSGKASSWQSSARLSVGGFSTGSLRVEGGATVSSDTDLIIGAGTGIQGDAVVTGAGSTLSAATQLDVGNYGPGTLRIENGGTAVSNQGYIGASGIGIVTVTGAGSKWTMTPFSLTIGNFGTGSLTIDDGGLVRADGGVLLGSSAGGGGTLLIKDMAGNRGVLETSAIRGGAGAASVTINGGILRATDDNPTFFDNFGPRDITVGADGAVVDTNTHDIGISPAFVGTGSLTKDGAGTLTLTGANTYANGTTIAAGTLQLGDGGTSGSILGNVIDNGALAFDRSDAVTFGGVISGSGALRQIGAGTTTLSGANSYRGATYVDTGTLLVNGDQSAATGRTTVASGATLGGIGVIGGDVSVASGGVLAAGSPVTAPGELGIRGSLGLSSGSVLDYQFGEADKPGGAFNDFIDVGANLTLDGTINVTVPVGGSFGGGLYRVLSYDGTLANHGLDLGTMPAGSDMYVQTSVANQVNLVNSAGLTLNFWDGPTAPRNDGMVDGGDGTWHPVGSDDSWTEMTGAVNAPYQRASFAVFAGAKGTVTVDDSTSAGAVTASGMQFATDGYIIKGDRVTLVGPQSIIRVGDGTAPGAFYTATVGAELTGNTQLVKTDLGTLVLAGNNTYTGGTAIDGGTLRIGSDANLGDRAGDVSFDAGTLNTTADLASARKIALNGNGKFVTDAGTTATLNGAVSGGGALAKAGGGALVLTADSSGYGGAAQVDAGTLAVNGKLGGSLAVGKAGRLAGTGQTGGVTNSGVVAPGFADAMATLTAEGDYAGKGGSLEIAAVLGDDNSKTSRLAVTGATSGETRIEINNRGGNGGQTVEGIKIVDVAGASEGHFTLDGNYIFHGDQAVVAGAYGYRLYQGGVSSPADGDWYLRSSLLDAGQAGDPTTPLYQPGVPVYEAYGASLLSLDTLPTLQQRVGNRYWTDQQAAVATPSTIGGLPNPAVDRNGVWGVIEGSHARLQPSHSTSQTDYDLNNWRMLAGIDALISESGKGKLIAGLTAHYAYGAAGITSVFGPGTIKTDDYGIGATATWYAANGFYIDAQAQASWYRSDLASGWVGDLASGNDGFGYAISLEGGQRFAIANNWAVIPQAQLAYSNVNFDAFTDLFGANVSLDRAASLRGRIGVSAEYQNSWHNAQGQVDRAAFYGIGNLYSEFLDGTKTDVSGASLVSKNDAVWGELGIGGSLNFSNDRFSIYGQVSTGTTLKNFGDSYTLGGKTGLRIGW